MFLFMSANVLRQLTYGPEVNVHGVTLFQAAYRIFFLFNNSLKRIDKKEGQQQIFPCDSKVSTSVNGKDN